MRFRLYRVEFHIALLHIEKHHLMAAFLPGFMLAGCYIIYILVRTRMNPSLAPLPEPKEGDMVMREKCLYGATLVVLLVGAAASIVTGRWLYLQGGSMINPKMIDENTVLIDNGTFYTYASIAVVCGLLITFGFSWKTAKEAWAKGKGMVAPLLAVFVVLGSIYGGITGITEAAPRSGTEPPEIPWQRLR